MPNEKEKERERQRGQQKKNRESFVLRNKFLLVVCRGLTIYCDLLRENAKCAH